MRNKAGFLKKIYLNRKFIIRAVTTIFSKKYFPFIACINITKFCNLKCAYCYAALDSLTSCPEPTKDEIIHLIDSCYDIGVRFIRLVGGEPLLRKEIGSFISYIKSKGMACEVATNGILIPRFINELKLADSLCVSIDGNKKENDMVRGNGTWEKVIAGIKAAVEAGISLRLHCVLARHTLRSVNSMSEITNRFGVRFNIGECYYQTSADPNFALSEDEISNFYKDYFSAKMKNKLVTTSLSIIDTTLNWPSEKIVITYDEVKKNPQIKKIIPECQFGHKEVFIDIDGMVYPCKRLWKKGFNYKTEGLGQAWRRVSESRDCYICREIGVVERAMCLGGSIKALLEAYRDYDL